MIAKLVPLVQEIIKAKPRQYFRPLDGMRGVNISSLEESIAFLEFVLPRLVGKREQAVLLLNHLKWRSQFPARRSKPYPDEVYRRDVIVWRRMRYLNRPRRFWPRTRRDHTEDAVQGEDMVPSPEQSGSAPKNEPNKSE